MHFYTNFGQLDYKTFYLVGYDNGVKYTRTLPLERTLYTDSPLFGIESPYKNVYGKPLRLLSGSEAREASKSVDVYGAPKATYQMIHELFPGANGVKFDFKLIRSMFIDIETETEYGFPNISEANERINLITIRQGDQIITFGLHPVSKQFPGVRYLNFNGDEKKMLATFAEVFQKLDPDVITGWNLKFFDLIYLANRFRVLFADTEAFASVSPFRKISRRETEIFNKSVEYVEIEGVSTIDYMDAYKKFIMKNQESMSLDAIAEKELGDKKVPWQEKHETFKDFYTNDWDLFVEYNIHDVNLVYQLDQKKKYLQLAAAIIYRSKVNFGDVFSQVKMWEQLIYCTIETNKKMLPPVKKSGKRTRIKGAYVKPPIPGRHEWVASVDAASLYPSIDIQFNISPETIQDIHVDVSEFNKLVTLEGNEELTEELKSNGFCVAANGSVYSTETMGFIPEIMDSLFTERKVLKKQMLNFKKLKEQVELRIKELEG